MANFYDVNAAIEKPNVLGALQQGMQFGQQQRALREQRADQQQLRSLAPQVQQGDPGAIMQSAAIDPQATSAQLSAGDMVTRRMEPLIRLLEEADARNPQEAQALWQSQGVPFVSQFSQGTQPTTDWQQAKPMLAQLKAKIEMAKASQPATAAGVQSTRIGRGDDGKFYYFTVDRTGQWKNSGVEADPRTQLRDQPGIAPSIVDLRGGTVSPLSEGQPAGGAVPPTGGVTNFDDQTPQQTQQMEATIQALHGAGASDEVISAYINSVRGQPRYVTSAGAPVAPPAGGLTATRPDTSQTITPYQQEQLDLRREGLAAAQAARDQATEARQDAAEAKDTAKREAAGARQAESAASAGDLISAIDALESHPGFDSLGTALGDAQIAIPLVRNDAKDADAQLRNISGQVALATMNRLKALSSQGATGFGALSQSELSLLQNSIATLQRENISNQQLKNSLSVIRQKMQKIEGWKPTDGGQGPREITSQAEYDVLPSGAIYLEDGKQYRKP